MHQDARVCSKTELVTWIVSISKIIYNHTVTQQIVSLPFPKKA